jgi:hypothetical protein
MALPPEKRCIFQFLNRNSLFLRGNLSAFMGNYFIENIH